MKKLILLVLPFVLFACSSDNDNTNGPSKKPAKVVTPTVNVPQFNADSAYKFVAQQVAFGPRVPNSEAHKQCGDWMISQLESYGWKVTVQEFQSTAYDGTVLDLRNITASYKPENRQRILLAAHWDSRHIADRDEERTNEPIDGANDGGSGVGVLMEIARTISESKEKPTLGIDIVFFDGEDYGQPDDSELPHVQDSWCLGSQYWAKNKPANYFPRYGILLDMVGAPNAKFAKEGVSMYYAKNIVDKVWKKAHAIGYSNYFTLNTSEQIIDDHTYVNKFAQIPMIDIIEFSPYSSNGGYFGNYHHTHEDNMDVIDRNTLKAVGQTVLHVAYTE